MKKFTRKVTFLHCEFCNKLGKREPDMRRHEAHCTKNPNRKCRVCEKGEFNLRRADFQKPFSWVGVQGVTECPVCQFAIARQRNIEVPQEWRLNEQLEQYHDRVAEESTYMNS